MTDLFHSSTASAHDAAQPPKWVGFALVAPEQGIDLASQGLTYGVPADLPGVVAGDRVWVPLGKGDKVVPGYVLQTAATLDLSADKLLRVKGIKRVDPAGLSLTPDLIELARWMAAYYCCPLGMVLVTMLPAAVKHGTGTKTRLFVRLNPQAAEVVPSDQPVKAQARKLTKLQRAALDVLRQRDAADDPWIELRELADLAGAKGTSSLSALVDRGLLLATPRAVVRGDRDGSGGHWETDAEPVTPGTLTPAELTLTPSQEAAGRRIGDALATGFGVHLLYGVTGSGKTEVYLRLIERLLNGQTADPAPAALVLVPEIALTPQTVSRFIARFGQRVAVLHSGLSASHRHEQWRRIRTGQASIVVGARSAVFAPLPNLRLIIVDEEHDASYKQDQLPRYHGRDVAVRRAQMLGIPVVLGSATPSLESYFNATNPQGRGYHLHELPDRVAGQALPKVRIVDLQEDRRLRRGVHLLSTQLEEALSKTLADGGQAILLLNRRGYANYIACPDHRCGWMLSCDHCDALMVYHKHGALPAGGLVRCHHCGAEQLLPAQCPVCARRVTVFGLGTQRVEEEIARKFPGVPMLRMDSDTMRTGKDYHLGLESFRRGELRVLLGTQMIAKGLDFPNVRLVGVISADTAIHMPDFRAAERTFQIVAQVAGRAGRSEHPGLVIVQTFSPHEPAITLAAAHDYKAFAQREIALRLQVGLPPATRLARIVVRDRDAHRAADHAQKLADALTQANEQLGNATRLRGPMPCPIARLADYHRLEIQLLAPDAVTLQKLLTAVRNNRLLKSDAHTAVDVDPVSLL